MNELTRQLETHARHRTKVFRNERMTALAGAILFVLIMVELVVTANLHGLITQHVFVGVLLSGPLVVKMFSTGSRFVRYYAKSPAFVRSGPPNPLLRLMAPFLVLLTLLVFISGFALAFVGPMHMGLFLKIHAASVALWIPMLAVHIYAHVRKVPSLIASEWAKQPTQRVSGRGGRFGINISALIIGAIAAVVMLPYSAPWSHWRIGQGLPSPLVLGIIAAVVAVLIAIPLLRAASRVRRA